MKTIDVGLRKGPVHEMIVANCGKDQNGKPIMIKKNDADFFHVLCCRKSFNPREPLNILEFYFVQCFDRETWYRLENLSSGGTPIDWQKAANVATARVVHNPDLKPKK